MRILATGDSHLGKGQDLGRTPGERLAEQEQVWRDTLALARDRQCDAVLHAGDLFDGRRPSPEIVLAAERPLVEHQEQGGCTVYAIAGNHDVPAQDGPCGLDVLAEAGLLELAREPHTWTIASGEQWVDVCALPWTPVSRLVAMNEAADRGDIHRLAADLLVQTARVLEVETRGSVPRILLGHWSVSQTSLPSGLDVGQLGGVVLPMDDLQQLGFDALVFGHIHLPQWHEGFLYTGSPQPLDFGEGDCKHGVWLLDIDGGDVASSFVSLPSRPFQTIDLADLVDLFGDRTVLVPRGGYVRVRGTIDTSICGEGSERLVRQDEIRDALLRAGAHRVWMDITVERQHRDRGVQFVDGQTRADQLAAYLAATGANGDTAALLTKAEAYLS